MQRSSRTAISALTRQHALQQFDHLGYSIIDGSQEEHGACSATARQSNAEVILVPRLRQALRDLNPDCPDSLLDAAIEALTVTDLGLVSRAHANERIYNLLRDGVKIDARGHAVPDPAANDASSAQDTRQDTHRTLQIINWQEPYKNDFTLVSRFWVAGKLGKRCLDLVAFVNGLPFILLEIADNELPNTFTRIDQDYKITIPALFWYNAFIVVADASTCKMGSLTTPWEHFFQWKRVHNEREVESTKLTTLIEGTCDKVRLLDIVENFTMFDQSKGLNKLVARNHQYLGVNNAIAALRRLNREREERRQAGLPEPRERHGKLGVFWHTQGSGKSYSMVFFVRKVQRTISNDYTFLVVTDRDELDKQIFDNFRHAGAINEDSEEVHAKSGKHLRRLLGESHLLLFTLIQKFRGDSKKPGKPYGKLSDREKIIVMADEAHRTQYDTLACNMREALPRASFIGFTGTPLMDGEEQTRATFGDYVSIYNFRRAINDGVTVPLFYENRTPQLDNVNANFQDELAEILDNAMLDERQEQKVIEQYLRAENIFVDPQRLDQVADHIVRHFMTRGHMGKAMVVSFDKMTAVRTYNRVRACWLRYQEELRAQLSQASDPDVILELTNKIAYMDETDMAVIVSEDEGSNREDGTRREGDVERFERFSRETGEQVEIAPHHDRFKTEKLARDFKNSDHKLRIAFVCAMWMTGFDVPCLSTIYLDRPLKGHTLMQTIARANRIYKDKAIGLIVDYSSSQRALKAALAIYAREDISGYQEGDRPVGDKSELVQALRIKLAETEHFCREQGIDVQDLLTKFAAEPNKRQREELVAPAVDTLVAYDDLKLHALLLTSEVNRFYKAILPDATEPEFHLPVHLFRLIKSGIQSAMSVSGTGYIGRKVKNLVRESLDVREHEERLSADTLTPRGGFDLLDIELEDLRTGHRHINAEQMRHLLYERIRRMVFVNPKRLKYLEKLDRIVDRYNEGCANLATDPQLRDPQENITQHPAARAAQEQLQDAYIDGLVELRGELVQEEQRSKQENLDEKELAIFDQLVLDTPLTEEDHTQLKTASRAILAGLRPTVTRIPDWHKKPLILGRVRIIIEDALSWLKQTYGQEVYDQKCGAVFLYIQEHYKDNGNISVA